jgi:hypothetical protein
MTGGIIAFLRPTSKTNAGPLSYCLSRHFAAMRYWKRRAHQIFGRFTIAPAHCTPVSPRRRSGQDHRAQPGSTEHLEDLFDPIRRVSGFDEGASVTDWRSPLFADPDLAQLPPHRTPPAHQLAALLMSLPRTARLCWGAPNSFGKLNFAHAKTALTINGLAIDGRSPPARKHVPKCSLAEARQHLLDHRKSEGRVHRIRQPRHASTAGLLSQ